MHPTGVEYISGNRRCHVAHPAMEAAVMALDDSLDRRLVSLKLDKAVATLLMQLDLSNGSIGCEKKNVSDTIQGIC